ncbi:MAG TPA: hypothetical protein VFT51_14295 [Bacillales bacterium]|nr:hypothetical protein [Bacillales bacterium]
MLTNILSITFLALLFGFIAWRKYLMHKVPKKQWEGHDPNEHTASTEELRQDQNKYRGFGQISGPM